MPCISRHTMDRATRTAQYSPLPLWVVLETPSRCAYTGRLSIMLKTDSGLLGASVLTDYVWNGKLAYRKDRIYSVIDTGITLRLCLQLDNTQHGVRELRRAWRLHQDDTFSELRGITKKPGIPL